MGLSGEEFDALFTRFDHDAAHLEMRDSYGTDTEQPHLAKWAAGEPDDFEWLRPWCDQTRAQIASGKVYRKAHVISEPLSDYNRWAHSITQPQVDVGEDIRWVPRRLVSSIAFPGNDFWMFDQRLICFLHYAGDGTNVDFTTSTDPHDVELCSSAFEAAWRLAIPHRDYHPA